MKFLFLLQDYPDFIRCLYTQHPGMEYRTFEEQMQVRSEAVFGGKEGYIAGNLCRLGHEVMLIYVNNDFMQIAWAREHGVKVVSNFKQRRLASTWKQIKRVLRRTPLRYAKGLLRAVSRKRQETNTAFYQILSHQIRCYKPDVVMNLSMNRITNIFLKEMKPNFRILVGQIASPVPKDEDFTVYDLVVSSLPNLVDYFRKRGVRSEFIKLAFEPAVLSALKPNDRKDVEISFIGSVFSHHSGRIALLEYLCERLPIQVWVHGIDNLSKESPIRARSKERQAWGLEMFRVFNKSKITLNHHIEIAGSYANNQRLYEATGVGTLLITDWKKNLHEIFKPDKEVVAYRSPEECADLIKYYLEHEEEREAIARAGQERTLREHTFYYRMQELVDIVKRYI